MNDKGDTKDRIIVRNEQVPCSYLFRHFLPLFPKILLVVFIAFKLKLEKARFRPDIIVCGQVNVCRNSKIGQVKTFKEN